MTYVFYFPTIDCLWGTFNDIKFAFYNILHTLIQLCMGSAMFRAYRC